MTIREKINYLTALENMIDSVEEKIYNHMNLVYDDETGEAKQDEKGEFIRKPPEKDDWGYNEYNGLILLMNQLVKLTEKA